MSVLHECIFNNCLVKNQIYDFNFNINY